MVLIGNYGSVRKSVLFLLPGELIIAQQQQVIIIIAEHATINIIIIASVSWRASYIYMVEGAYRHVIAAD